MKNVFLDPMPKYWRLVWKQAKCFKVTLVYFLWRRNGENLQVHTHSRNLIAIPHVLYFSVVVLHSSKIQEVARFTGIYEVLQ
jgi:hypothetical protein